MTRRKEPELVALMPFDALERYIARVHPDPDDVRQNAAEKHGTPLAAPWIAELIDVPWRSVVRLRRNGVPYFRADEFATRLGVHPSVIWANWWTVEVEEFWREMRAAAFAESVELRRRLVVV